MAVVSIEDYLELLDLPHSYEVEGEEVALGEFDGVSVPVETGDREFYSWRLQEESDQYSVVLSQNTPGDLKELGLEEVAERLETGEFIPTIRTDEEYREADLE